MQVKLWRKSISNNQKPTQNISKSSGLSWKSRITKGEKEVAKRRAEIFFQLKPGLFVAFADGKDKKVYFKLQSLRKVRLEKTKQYSEADVNLNFKRIHREVERLRRNESNYVHNRIHVYSRRLIDFCTKYRTGTLIL